MVNHNITNSMKTQLQDPDTSEDTTLKITRTINAPRQKVFEAWTDFQQLELWWGPEGVKTEALIFEARAGGKFRWELTTPKGERMVAHGDFRQVRQDEKIAFTWHPGGSDPERFHSIVTVEFHEKEPDITELCLKQENLPSEESRDEHTEGWNSALDKLERQLVV